MSQERKIKIFAPNAHPEFAKAIAAQLGLPLGKSEVKMFSDGEVSVSISESVRGSDVFIVQPTCNPVNDNLMELLIMCDAAKRASAHSITAVVPYYGYARQDRTAKARDPISAKLVADLITTAGFTRLLTMDLHAPQIQGFFNIPVDNLFGSPILAAFIRSMFPEGLKNVTVTSPDAGSIARSRKFVEMLNGEHVPLAIVDKRRQAANVSEVMNIIGDVKDRDVVIFDDMVDTAGTLVHAAEALKQFGARTVTAAAVHPVLSGVAIERLSGPAVDRIVFTDTIPIPPEKLLPKMQTVSVAPMFAEAIARIYSGQPLSPLYS